LPVRSEPQDLGEQRRFELDPAEVQVGTGSDRGEERAAGLQVQMRKAHTRVLDADADAAINAAGWPRRRQHR
jgi:hypothetical protein